MPHYRVTITGPSDEAMADLVLKHEIDVFRHGRRVMPDSGFTVDAIVDEAQIRQLEASEYQIERHEDVDEVGKARQQEVGRRNRYEQFLPPSPPY
jgi:hypothetical protein